MNPGRKLGIVARLRYMWRQLSRSRAVSVVSGVWPNAYRVLLLVSAVLLIDLAFPGGGGPDLPVLEERAVASEEVIAPITFPVMKSDAALARERAAAAAAVSPIFEHRSEFADSAIADARLFFEAIEASLAAAQDSAARRQAVRETLELFPLPASENQVEVLADDNTRRRLRRAVERAFDQQMRRGVATSNELGRVGTASVVLRRDSQEPLVPRDSLPTMQRFFERAAALAPSDMGGEAVRLYQNLIIRFAQPTIRLDTQATEAARDQARASVDPIKYEVLEGERIVAAHERVGEAELEKLRALQAQVAEAGGGRDWRDHAGSLLYNLLLLTIFGLVLRYYRFPVYESARSLTLVWFLVMVVAAAGAVIARTGEWWQLIPVAFAALTLATLYDGLLALVTVLILVGLVAIRAFEGVTVPFFTVVGGAAAALSGRVVRRRAQTWAFAAVIAGAYALAAVSLGLVGRLDTAGVFNSSLLGTVNAVACALVAAGILPLAESFTRITTDQSLLELADLNRPLLRRLSLEAPGTYAHSINVANLAEAAAREIGANSLLARVGIYYHDIGKVKKPQYFVENQPTGSNPHDKLKPGTSAGIVREHVNEGLELAEEARLPDVVKAFITEHHGTQKIGFFWEKATEQRPERELNPADFRYPGPKPQTKETAIALLADSVESAARVLQDPTPERIEELVDRIVAFKISERQLDEAPLTLREISIIKQQFVKVLTSMYHHRLDYPTQPQPAANPQEPAAHGTP